MALIDIVQWKNAPGEIIYRFPEGAISLGAQVFVMENQEAILFKDGKALDSFAPGRHTLVTGNIPLLDKLVNLPFGGQSPFPAEVYFINKTEVPNMKWGTKLPLQLQDPVYNVAIPVRAFGSYSIKVVDARALLIMAIGTWHAASSEQMGTSFRDLIILPKLQDFISETLYGQKISVLKIATLLDEIGSSGKDRIANDFSGFGVELVRFVVESINVPEDDESVRRLKKALADKAEIDILGQDSYKMKRTFDTMEKAASAEGGGGMMGAGMGLGAGASMGAAMKDMMQGAMSGSKDQSKVLCPHCRAENAPQAKFCSACGKEMAVTRACPACNKQVPADAKFCPECGANMQETNCPSCNAVVKPGAKFCPECGKKLG
ncbi:MAG: SPFH domain-containing protein [Spirochaetes bacterium]|nr:MAG: SPFH domain-containing protein [Spirochaetota bacterium]